MDRRLIRSRPGGCAFRSSVLFLPVSKKRGNENENGNPSFTVERADGGTVPFSFQPTVLA